MIQLFNLNRIIILFFLLFIFSCSSVEIRALKIIGLNQDKTLTINVNERKSLDIILPDERESDFLKIISDNPSIVEVESSRTRVIRGVKNGKAKLGVFYKQEKVIFDVEVYENTIQTK